jgi:hypothetical protein
MDTNFLRNMTVPIFGLEYPEDWGSTFLQSTGSHYQTPWHHSPVDHSMSHHCLVSIKSVIHVRCLVLLSWNFCLLGCDGFRGTCFLHLQVSCIKNVLQCKGSKDMGKLLLLWLPKRHQKICDMRPVSIMNINIKSNHDAVY